MADFLCLKLGFDGDGKNNSLDVGLEWFAWELTSLWGGEYSLNIKRGIKV